MLKLAAAVFVIAIIAVTAGAQAPTLQILQPDGPNLPSELWYGNVKVKPLRFRPGTNTPITIDDSDFFVSQTYIDFLGRFADSGGLDYWANQQINTPCGADQTCIYNRRVAVSAAFFISPEFQQTGYYVYRFYAGTLGRQPSYAEFTPDRLQVIGGANLDTSKAAFADAWVQRPAFLALYPNTMTNDQFVNAVIQTMKTSKDIANNDEGYDLSSQASNFISQLNGGASRGSVVRQMIDDAGFQNKEFNPGFVLMQYFGYLRRGADTGGYNFWLNDSNAGLNHKPPVDHSYQTMVCAFVTSPEYQFRFSSTVTKNDQGCNNIP